ncbi:MAG: hypothetical protein QXT63_05595 [Thermoplasmata archaeon]
MSRIVVCPKCKFKFDIGYGRAFACKGCPSSLSARVGLLNVQSVEMNFQNEFKIENNDGN